MRVVPRGFWRPRLREQVGRLRPLRLLVLVGALLCLVVTEPARADQEVVDLWSGLEAGRYAVGFKVLQLQDADRPFGVEATPRPLQILIWYPATSEGRHPRVSYEEYFRLAATEIELSKPNEELARAHLLEVRKMACAEGASGARFDAMVGLGTRARWHASPAGGRFRAVIFAPGLGAPAFQSSVLCEYLASHGFVVAASASVGPTERAMPHTVAGVEAQVADIRLTAGALREHAGVASGKIGLVGFSWGGLAALIAAMGEREVGAVVALDPTVMVRTGHQLARTVPAYDPGSIQAPTMIMIAGGRRFPERDLTFLSEITAAEATLVTFHDLLHGDFASIIIQLFLETRPDPGGRDVGRVRIGYWTMCRYLEAFLGAHLDGSDTARRFQDQDPIANGVPAGVVSIERKAPQREAPQRPVVSPDPG